MEQISQNTALIIIDVQKGFDEPVWGERNNPQAEDNIVRLLEAWRKYGRPVFHVQHMSLSPSSPLNPDHPGNAIKDELQPREGESLIQKNVNSAFIGTDLEQQLRARGCNSLVIVGLTTPHCVSTTTRMAGNFGFETYLVSDATAAFELTDHNGRTYSAQEIHDVTLTTLNGEFAKVIETDMLLRLLED
ncbi:MAG TPA: cysteine hydrolase family protein [Anaerolineales bacterium]|nr:cysteine hydrolase family protein [Anaerolineales bacterium]HNM36434.1 cysteine hydrolase family protein [Anaerolineales bacterium]